MNPPAVGSDSKMAEVYARGPAEVIQSQRMVVERRKVLVGLRELKCSGSGDKVCVGFHPFDFRCWSHIRA